MTSNTYLRSVGDAPSGHMAEHGDRPAEAGKTRCLVGAPNAGLSHRRPARSLPGTSLHDLPATTRAARKAPR